MTTAALIELMVAALIVDLWAAGFAIEASVVGGDPDRRSGLRIISRGLLPVAMAGSSIAGAFVGRIGEIENTGGWAIGQAARA